jgi:hypothetical protein
MDPIAKEKALFITYTIILGSVFLHVGFGVSMDVISMDFRIKPG